MRPQTLPAGGAPVLIGIGLAVADGIFEPWPAIGALVGALLIQVGTNFANDYYDAVNGADTEEREGFTRVTAGGLIEPTRVKQAMAGTYALALVVGVSLVYVGGLPIVVVGLSSILAGLLYTGGPYPYGYYGLGDLFVFLYFGLIAVAGTYYVQAVVALGEAPLPLWVPPATVTAGAVLAGVAAGGLSTTILVVNNIRDRETDKKAGKRTLAVMLATAGHGSNISLWSGRPISCRSSSGLAWGIRRRCWSSFCRYHWQSVSPGWSVRGLTVTRSTLHWNRLESCLRSMQSC